MKFRLVFFALFFASRCIAHEVIVSGDSVGDLVVGKKPPFKKGRLLFRKWQNDENGERYELLRVKVNGIPVDAELYNGDIWRIWIDKPGLITRGGVGVGGNVKNLLLRNRDFDLEIGPGPSLVLIPKDSCGISFVTNAKLPDQLPEKLDRTYALTIARDAEISKIILVGCDN